MKSPESHMCSSGTWGGSQVRVLEQRTPPAHLQGPFPSKWVGLIIAQPPIGFIPSCLLRSESKAMEA